MGITVFPPQTEPNNLGDLLKFEADNLYSRDRVTVAPQQALQLGHVVGRVTETGQMAALDPAATDGREQPVGIVIVPILTADTPRTDGLIVARHATVADHALVWPKSITPQQQAVYVQQLRAIGVLVRQGI